MRIPLLALMILTLALPACARFKDARINPRNWFKPREAQTLEPKDGYERIIDNRIPVDQVLSLVVEPVPGGAIVRATGLPPTQGYWAAELVPEGDGTAAEGTLAYRFVVFAPPDPQPASTQASREIIAGVYLSTIDLAEVRQITVSGARNSVSARR